MQDADEQQLVLVPRRYARAPLVRSNEKSLFPDVRVRSRLIERVKRSIACAYFTIITRHRKTSEICRFLNPNFCLSSLVLAGRVIPLDSRSRCHAMNISVRSPLPVSKVTWSSRGLPRQRQRFTMTLARTE